MKVTIKNINKEVYTFEIDGDKTVLDLKNLIFEKYNQNPTWQTLIYSGKILDDKNTLESYKITESGFIVMMIKKPRETTATTTQPSESTSSNTSTSTSTSTTTSTTAPSTTTPVTPNPTPTTTSTPGTSTTTPSNNTTSPSQTNTNTSSSSSTDFVTGPELENTIKNIMDMGFTREKVIRALRLGYNNADRAVELLLSGEIPENAAADEEDEDNMDVGGNVEQPIGGENPFEALRNHPYFPALRQAIAQDPNIIQGLLQQLAQTNPDLVRQISEHPNEFLRIFQEEGGNGGSGNPGQFTIQVTREENEAIERLQQLTGLEKQVVIEAYFACDKNEELTASYLFENQDD